MRIVRASFSSPALLCDDVVHMHVFFEDETIKTSNDGEFFVYGGLFLSDTQVVELHQVIRAIRENHSLGSITAVAFDQNGAITADFVLREPDAP